MKGMKTSKRVEIVIVGGSGVVTLVMWFKTYLRKPLDPQIILPVFFANGSGVRNSHDGRISDGFRTRHEPLV